MQLRAADVEEMNCKHLYETCAASVADLGSNPHDPFTHSLDEKKSIRAHRMRAIDGPLNGRIIPSDRRIHSGRAPQTTQRLPIGSVWMETGCQGKIAASRSVRRFASERYANVYLHCTIHSLSLLTLMVDVRNEVMTALLSYMCSHCQ